MIANHTPWSPAERATLRRVYRKRGWAAACRALPGRKPWTIYVAARRLGLTRKQWSAREKHALVMLWGELRLSAVAKRLGRSQRGCYKMAQRLGLRVGCPNGYEYLRQAGLRTGYQVQQLRRILATYDVRIYLRLSYFKGKGAPHRQHYVDPEEVDRAVFQWVSSEPVAAAARRIGVPVHRLRRWAITARAGRQGAPGAYRRLTAEETLRAFIDLHVPARRRPIVLVEAAA